jgi:hypothetical protein
VTTLPRKIIAIHRSVAGAGIPHAFGGALALAWCTERARGTIDIDLNIFLDASRAADVLAALPRGVRSSARDLAVLTRDGQTRLWWDETPVDLFVNTTEFHAQAAGRCRVEKFAGDDVPFLSCSDLAVFKAFFNRTRDWADLEEMVAVGTLDVDRVVGTLTRYLGPTDERVERLRRLA